ncbi:MAG TPA: hypothetical protein VGM87_14235 [Roseomonas sp.]|jgi:hypothetical protein
MAKPMTGMAEASLDAAAARIATLARLAHDLVSIDMPVPAPVAIDVAAMLAGIEAMARELESGIRRARLDATMPLPPLAPRGRPRRAHA